MNNRGTTYCEERDGPRLAAQLQTVMDIMRDGKYRTLTAIAMRAHAPEASVSARLREIRSLGRTVEKVYVANGLWRYRVVPA